MKKTYIILLIFIIVIIGVVMLLMFGQGEKSGQKLNANIKESITWTTFSAKPFNVEISYPTSWRRQYSASEFDRNFELQSDETITYKDSISGTSVTEPLIKIYINRSDDYIANSLNEWIDKASATKNEQWRVRKDKDGWSGIEQWIWTKENAYSFSIFNYYLDVNHQVVQVSAWIMDDNPNSERFKNAKVTVEEIFSRLSIITN